jgi:pimeloyl-ACP methyl ester carboxylesterase
VIAPDLPGFGKNPPLLTTKPSLEAYADFIARELQNNGHEQVVAAGMSMGGYVALAFAEKYPKMISGLGLISTQSAADTPEVKEGRKKSIEKIREAGVQVVIDTLVPKMFSDRANAAIREYLKEGATRAGVEGLCWALEAMAARPDRTSLLKSLSYPILILHGTDDKIVPFEKARELAEVCQVPLFVEVPGAGHATPLEAPERVASGLVALLQAVKRSPGE